MKKNQTKALSIKLLLIGNSAVGKTCMLLRYCDNSFMNDHMTTIGVDFKIKRTQLAGVPLHINIWDTAGQERFKHITKSFFKGADGILICYSINDRESFNNVENWLSQIKDLADKKVQVVLTANKSDLSSERKVSQQQGQQLGKKYGLEFFQCSAKTGQNIEKIFDRLSTLVVQKNDPESLKKNLRKTLLTEEPKSKNQKCC